MPGSSSSIRLVIDDPPLFKASDHHVVQGSGYRVSSAITSLAQIPYLYSQRP
jgi:hypothetical protein